MLGRKRAVKQPKGFWFVTIISLLWNGYGSFNFIMANIRDPQFLAAMGSTEMVDFMDSLPIYITAAWGIGAGASLLGSLLLVMKSRFADKAFMLSLAGAVVSYLYQYTNRPPEAMLTPAGLALTGTILLAILFFLWFSLNSRMKGILR